MKSLGIKGEEAAVEFLLHKGYKIVAKNFKSHFGEVDIIALDGKTLVFVEVKTRSNDSFGLPHESVIQRKMRHIIRTAQYYLSRLKEVPLARFDVISIQEIDGKPNIEHIKDAFELA